MTFLQRLSIPLLILLHSFSGQCQSFPRDVVYEGRHFMMMASGGMSSHDYVYYFRTNGTFCSELGKPDWKTLVSGNYTVAGNSVKLSFANGQSKELHLEKAGGTATSGGTVFSRVYPSDRVKPGYYKFIHTMGGGTLTYGSPYVGGTNERGLYLSGDGRFNHSGFSAIGINGSAVAGGSVRDNSNNGGGTYTLKDGELTLTYSDGRITKHSFFSEDIVAVVDGAIYFLDDDKKSPHPSGAPASRNSAAASSPANHTPASSNPPLSNPGLTTSPGSRNTSHASASPGTQPAANASINMEQAKTYLHQINHTHGGADLDNLSAIRAVFRTNGILFHVLADCRNQRVRVERYNGDKCSSIEQLEGNSGWTWNGRTAGALSAERISQLQLILTGGMLGLRWPVLSAAPVSLYKTAGNYTSVLVEPGGHKVGYIFNNNTNRAEGMVLPQTNPQISIYYSDYRPVGNLLLPFAETMKAGTMSQKTVYEQYQVNPALTAADWARP